MGDFATVLPAAGGLAVLAMVIGYLLTGNRADRVDYRGALASERREADVARTERDHAEQGHDAERELRRRAQDESAAAVRVAERHAEQVAQFTATVAELQSQVKALQARVEGGGDG